MISPVGRGIGNGVKWSYFGRLLVTGTQAIPNVLTCVDNLNFNLLAFDITPDGLVDYTPADGIFTFKRKGMVDIAATLNIVTTAGNTEVEVITEYDEGAGFVKRNARTAELPVIGEAQTTLEGTLEQVNKGHRLRFFVRSPDASASFKTAILPDTSVVPAIILHMKMFTR
jgi:hypothetical protein